MERFAKQYGIPIGLLLIKLLVTLRTGIDTYHVSNDWLDVLVIDGVYLVLWLIAAYSGKGQAAMALRPFAAGGAWVLYGLMLYIAIVAGNLAGGGGAVAVSLIARVAGAVLLLYDTYDYVQELVQKRSKEAQATWKDSLRGSINALAYALGAFVAVPLVAILALVQVVKDYSEDSKRGSKPIVIVEGKAEPKQLPPVSPAKTVKKLDATNRKLLALWRSDPHLSNPQAGEKVGLTGEAIRLRKIKLQEIGAIHVNGHGVEILE